MAFKRREIGVVMVRGEWVVIEWRKIAKVVGLWGGRRWLLFDDVE